MRKSKISASLLLMAMILMLSIAANLAPVQGAPYNYTVRVFAGNQGSMKGQVLWTGSYSAGDECFLPRSEAETALGSGSLYYVKGFKESGYIGDAVCVKENFIVDRDYDFVVAYGIPDHEVSYTVSFVEKETGQILAEPMTYYGNEGDKPVVAYQYIQGYRPLYRNITATLKASDNHWTFEYVKIPVPEIPAVSPDQPQTPAAQGQPQTPAAQGQPPTLPQGQDAGTQGQPPTLPQGQDAGMQGQPEALMQSQNVVILNQNSGEDQGSEQIPGSGSDNIGGTVNTSTGEIIGIAQDVADDGTGGAAGNGTNDTQQMIPDTNTAGSEDAGGIGTQDTGDADVASVNLPETEEILDLDVPLAAPGALNPDNTADQKNAAAQENEITGETGTSADKEKSTDIDSAASDQKGETTHGKALPEWLLVVIIAGCAVIIGLLVWLILRNRRKV